MIELKNKLKRLPHIEDVEVNTVNEEQAVLIGIKTSNFYRLLFGKYMKSYIYEFIDPIIPVGVSVLEVYFI